MTAHTFPIKLQARQELTPDTWALQLERPVGFDFTPGQYIRFHEGGRLRDYTLINAPEATHLEICVRYLPEGHFTPTLLTAPPGHTFVTEGPLGYFRFQSDPARAVFVATGTGIAPFVAFARAGIRDFTLLHGASTAPDLHFADELRSAAARYQACLSAVEAPRDGAALRHPEWQHSGRVTDLLRSMPAGRFDFYLCGSATMIGDAIKIIDEGFEGASIFTERFY